MRHSSAHAKRVSKILDRGYTIVLSRHTDLVKSALTKRNNASKCASLSPHFIACTSSPSSNIVPHLSLHPSVLSILEFHWLLHRVINLRRLLRIDGKRFLTHKQSNRTASFARRQAACPMHSFRRHSPCNLTVESDSQVI